MTFPPLTHFINETMKFCRLQANQSAYKTNTVIGSRGQRGKRDSLTDNCIYRGVHSHQQFSLYSDYVKNNTIVKAQFIKVINVKLSLANIHITLSAS
jgi:hypothetical protein